VIHWDSDKLDAFHLAFVRRKAVEERRAWKIAMTAALFANSRLMDTEGAKVRDEMLNNIEEAYQKSVDAIYGAKDVDDIIPTDDPLFSNIRSVMDDDVQFDDGSTKE
jgi:hypothetical protein